MHTRSFAFISAALVAAGLVSSDPAAAQTAESLPAESLRVFGSLSGDFLNDSRLPDDAGFFAANPPILVDPLQGFLERLSPASAPWGYRQRLGGGSIDCKADGTEGIMEIGGNSLAFGRDRHRLYALVTKDDGWRLAELPVAFRENAGGIELPIEAPFPTPAQENAAAIATRCSEIIEEARKVLSNPGGKSLYDGLYEEVADAPEGLPPMPAAKRQIASALPRPDKATRRSGSLAAQLDQPYPALQFYPAP